MANPYLILDSTWHKTDPRDATKLVCGASRPLKGQSPAPTRATQPAICPGCRPAFPAQ
jgi:hypothetical protein